MEESGKNKVAVFGGGCFWCTEAVFSELKGVISVMPGYSGGTMANPSYEDVCLGKTGHAEVIKITYDPGQITYNNLLTIFFATHDPTAVNRQGNDVGTQYRSVVFYADEEQKREAEKFIENLNVSGPKVVTEVKPLENFYEAEEYHRNYYKNNSSAPYCQVVISPKLDKLKEKFSRLLKSSQSE
ncbi:MAG: peptide-methionine (S)-S-oxide reductase MsrA [Candidatus Liptonbacteria bacterium]|nr:peptide-methionine (S)-S-oxide reductase MsrA [Candidatus Liptonbacteria bacterium]